MPFTINLSGTAQVDDSVRAEFDAEFRVALAEQGAAAQFASIKKDFEAESISLPKYDQLGLAVTPLVETDDVDSEAMVDSKVLVNPKEYGKVVTTTKLASLQTAGMADRAAARLVGINAGRTDNKLAILALDASTNRIYSNAGGEAAITASDIMTGTLMGTAFNKLARKEAIGVANGDYVMLAHDDVIHDLREATGAASWIDVHKYALPETALRNEVGMYKGIRVVRDNLTTIKTDAGVGGVDVYISHVLGFNAFGKGTSHDIEMRATGPYDKLNRFVNLGWYGVFEYKIVEQDALWSIYSASSVGQNA
jgi:N4-gp56 family major capsid protein